LAFTARMNGRPRSNLSYLWSMHMATLTERLHGAIRIVPDFPKPGISFKDISPLFLQPQLVADATAAICTSFRNEALTHVIGIESRGFLLGPMIAAQLELPFVIVRKKGKLPYATREVTYDLEYGNATLEMHTDVLSAESRVLIHDDLLATGGTAAATAGLCRHFGAGVQGFSFVVELEELDGRAKLEQHAPQVHSLVCYER